MTVPPEEVLPPLRVDAEDALVVLLLLLLLLLERIVVVVVVRW